MRHKHAMPRTRQSRRLDALAWLAIAAELASIAVIAHAAFADKPAPVEISPEIAPPVHIITPEPEKESPRYSAANPAQRLDAEEEEQGSGADGADERRSAADFSTTTDKPEDTPAPTWDVVPSLGDDPQARQTPEPDYPRTSKDEIVMLGLEICGEAKIVQSTMEQAGAGWCVLNRVDDPRFPNTIAEVIAQPGQFHGYWAALEEYGECPDYFYDLAEDIVIRWEREKDGETDVGRVLPAEYLYFEGDMTAHNYFRTEWMGGLRWWWTADNPYDD